jgi:hypothetical protein
MIGACPGVSSDALRKVLGGISSLTWVDLTDVEGVDDSVLVALAESNPLLQGAHLGGCMSVGDEGIVALSKCKHLRRVSNTYRHC